jgi:hypothetical protein
MGKKYFVNSCLGVCVFVYIYMFTFSFHLIKILISVFIIIVMAAVLLAFVSLFLKVHGIPVLDCSIVACSCYPQTITLLLES